MFCLFGDYLKLYYYYINKEQKLVAMYLELIFTEIKLKMGKLQRYDYLAKN